MLQAAAVVSPPAGNHQRCKFPVTPVDDEDISERENKISSSNRNIYNMKR
jgi:hypothetical protein